MIDIRAKKSLGQNFLVNRGVLEKIVAASELTSNDKIIEIGPGKGVLTEALAERAGTVIAIEKDHRLIEHLRATVGTRANVSIIEKDVLEWRPDVKAGEYKIVANLPYYITSHFLRTVFESWPRPALMVLMVQKEVAQRIITQPPRMNLLAISIQYYAHAEIIASVSRGSFRPAPNVDSAIIKLLPKEDKYTPEESEHFFSIVRAGFHAPRKQLIKNLIDERGQERIVLERQFSEIGISLTVRPENLSLDQWNSLAQALK